MTIRIYAKGRQMMVMVNSNVFIKFKSGAYDFKTLEASEKVAMKALREVGWRWARTFKVKDPNPFDQLFGDMVKQLPAHSWGNPIANLFGGREPDILDADVIFEGDK